MFKIETKKTKLKDKCTSCVPQFFPQKKKKKNGTARTRAEVSNTVITPQLSDRAS